MRISDWSSDVCSSDLHAVASHQMSGADRHQHRPRLFHPPLHPRAPAPVAVGEDRLARCGDAVDILVDHFFERRDVAAPPRRGQRADVLRSEEHTSELQSLMRISYAVFCLKKKNKKKTTTSTN